MAHHPEPGADIQKREIKNGLTVISEAMPHLRSVSIGVWVIGGSRFEEKKLGGISHFIEHLLFKGTTSLSAGEIARAIDSVGGQLDAFTDKEYVGLYARVMDRHLAHALEILSDIILNPTFPSAEIKRERNVIFEEINAVEDSPQDLIHDLYLESLWPDHPLGRPVSGTKASVARIARRDILEFFRRHYSARNMVMTIAGNIRHREVQQLAAQHFGPLRSGTSADPGPPPRVRPARAIQEKANLEQMHICLGTSCPPLLSQDRFCAHLLCTILGGGMSSRLFQNIRERRGLVYSIESTLNLYRDAGTLAVSAAAAPGAAVTVVDLIMKELRKIRRDPVSAEELKRAKEFVQGSLLLGLESSSSRMTHLAQQHIYFGRIFSLKEILRQLDKVSTADIRRLANEMFQSTGIHLTALGNNSRPELESIELKV
jgi:predicted Zn-dependent peptidase